MLRNCLLADRSSDVSWTQFYGVFNKKPAPTARQFNNTLRMTNSVPIGASTQADVAVTAQSSSRALLTIQNASTATAPDFAPIFWVNFGAQAVIGQDLALAPGVGLVYDTRTPSDAIYVTIGEFDNTNGTVVIQGVIKEGAITDPENDTTNITETGQLAELISLLKQYFQTH